MKRTIHDHPIDTLVQSVYELGRTLRQRMVSCDMGDLHMGQIHALLFVQEREGITMKELAGLLRVTSPSATSFVDRLVKLGYVVRLQDPKNRRLVRLKISEAGTKMLREKMAERRKIFAEILSVLSDNDQKTLSAILRKVLDGCSS